MENHGLDGDDLTGCVTSFTSANSVPLDTTFGGPCYGHSVLSSRLFTEVTRLNRSPSSLIAHR